MEGTLIEKEETLIEKIRAKAKEIMPDKRVEPETVIVTELEQGELEELSGTHFSDYGGVMVFGRAKNHLKVFPPKFLDPYVVVHTIESFKVTLNLPTGLPFDLVKDWYIEHQKIPYFKRSEE